MLDNRQCSSSRYRSYIRTLDNNFCCSGGTSSYYRKCKAGSGSTYYPYNTTYKPYFSTTYKPFNSTYRPNGSTKKPSTVYRSRLLIQFTCTNHIQGNFHGKYCNTINQVSIVYNMLIVNYLYMCV